MRIVLVGAVNLEKDHRGKFLCGYMGAMIS